MSFGDDTLDPSNVDDAVVIHNLRLIRDLAWQYGRCHEIFSTIEKAAEVSLAHLGIKDGPPYPNPRSPGWWNHKGDSQ